MFTFAPIPINVMTCLLVSISIIGLFSFPTEGYPTPGVELQRRDLTEIASNNLPAGDSIKRETLSLGKCPSDNIGPHTQCQNLLDHCYCFVSKIMQTRKEAMSFCEANSMSLVSIETKEEDDALSLVLLNDEHFEGTRFYWTSGSDDKQEGQWYWTGNVTNKMTYTNWCPDEPNNVGKAENGMIKMHPLMRGSFHKNPKLGCWVDMGYEGEAASEYWRNTYAICESPNPPSVDNPQSLSTTPETSKNLKRHIEKDALIVETEVKCTKKGMPTNCLDLQCIGHRLNGLYAVSSEKEVSDGNQSHHVKTVYCDFSKSAEDPDFEKILE